MRIAIVSPYDLTVPGGVQVHVHALAAALRSHGDDVDVVGPGTDGPRRRGLGRAIAVPANGSRAPIALDPRVLGRVRAALVELDPEVVHVHEPMVPLVGPAALLGARAPVVATFHASAEAGLLPYAYRAIRRPARALLDRVVAYTAVSPVAAAFHAGALGLDPDRFTIVPNGVDLARFSSGVRRPERAGTPMRLVFLGRLEHRKGADLAVRAFLELASHRPELRLQVIGDGPQASAVRSLVASAPRDAGARIELLGRVEPAELPALLAAADVILLPSRGGESFGLVLLEAMAAGAAIVASDIPGYRAVARQDMEALLVRPEDAAALAAATGRVLDDPLLRDRLRSAGTARAAEFDWGAVAARMREVYVRAVVGDRPDRPGR